ncbi:MAG: S-layer homology domain-containing protein [Clostridiales Family XIII bacterium]|nr:S-layer homology domain-containing protein [Clostridiales Family XIII bacterium]
MKTLGSRIVCALSCAALVFAAAFPVSAATAETGAGDGGAGLEAAILTVKEVVDIPAALERFDYGVSEDEDGRLTYSLSWSGDDGYAGAAVRGGRLLSYNGYAGNRPEGSGAAAMRRDEALKAARAFLGRVDAGMALKMALVDDGSLRDTSVHSFSFMLEENGVAVDFVTARLSVDRYSGEVRDYYWIGLDEELSLPSADPAVDAARAKEIYLAEDGLSLRYGSWYDYDARESSVFAEYAVRDGGLAIDALTGEPLSLSSGISPMYDRMTAAAESAGGGSGLSEAEISAVDAISGMKTPAEAQAALAAAFPELSGLKLSGSSLSNSPANRELYRRSLYFSSSDGKISAQGSVDARTGEILSWGYYSPDEKKGKSATGVDAALAAAKRFLEQFAPAKYAQSVLDSRSVKESEGLYAAFGDMEYLPEGYRFRFDRYVNGLQSNGEGLFVVVDMQTGRLKSYSCNWNESLEFPPLGDVITSAAAFDIFSEPQRSVFGLKYSKVYDSGGKETRGEGGDGAEIRLVYHWASVPAYALAPADGTPISSDGKPYREPVYGYGDLGGHWAEEIVTELLESGYYLVTESGDFEPAGPVSQEAFLRYLYSPSQARLDQDGFYRMMEGSGVVEAGERDPEAGVTRYDAAKFALRYLGQDRLASRHEIFKNPFGDAVAEGYLGYVASAKALSVMDGDAAGNFGGDRILSRAEAAAVVYKALRARE